jgi:DNA-binding XRE family transcriptional regulator
MKQSDVAILLNCTTQSIRFWETGRTCPTNKYMVGVLKFLGYDPRPGTKNLGEKIKQYRTRHGMGQRELAKRLGVDPSSIWAWETEAYRPTSRHMSTLENVLSADG